MRHLNNKMLSIVLHAGIKVASTAGKIHIHFVTVMLPCLHREFLESLTVGSGQCIHVEVLF